MKKFAKLAGIIAVAAVIGLFSSCGEMGGTIEVTNGMSINQFIVVTAGLKTLSVLGLGDEFTPGQTMKYTIDFDSNVKVETYGYDALKLAGLPCFTETVNVSKGVTKKVTVKF
jgi:hypothetical protein